MAVRSFQPRIHQLSSAPTYSVQNPKKVSVRIKSVLLGRFNQAVDHRAGLGIAWDVGKKRFFHPSKKLYAALSMVVAPFQSAVSQIMYQILPLFQQLCSAFDMLIR